MKPVDNETIVKQLQWRYATKRFDPARKIPAEDWKTLESAVLLAPSSYGLQPYKFIVITDPAVRIRLREASRGQAQIVDASHLVVFSAKSEVTPADIGAFVARIAATRGVPIVSLDDHKNRMIGSLQRPAGELTHWARRQAYIALGIFLATAAMLNIDACPMEGFDPQQYDEILGLGKLGYTASVLATAGYRAADDHYATLAKVRLPQEQAFVRV
jgi:nitroreductase